MDKITSELAKLAPSFHVRIDLEIAPEYLNRSAYGMRAWEGRLAAYVIERGMMYSVFSDSMTIWVYDGEEPQALPPETYDRVKELTCVLLYRLRSCVQDKELLNQIHAAAEELRPDQI